MIGKKVVKNKWVNRVAQKSSKRDPLVSPLPLQIQKNSLIRYIISGIRYIRFALNPVCDRPYGFKWFCIISKYPKNQKRRSSGNIENFSKKRFIQCTLYPEFVISGVR